MITDIIAVLGDFFKEFIPAVKTEILIIGWSLIAICAYVWWMAYASGLHGQLRYLPLSPGCTVTGIAAGFVLIVLAISMPKQVRRLDQED